MFDDLKTKTALVTGASSGLGRHFATVLARHGVAVTLAARRAAVLDEAAREIAAAGGTARVVEMDVADRASVETAVRSVEGRIDILVNNAGVSVAGKALDMTEEAFDRVLGTNLKGAFLVAQAVGRRMREQGGGAVVNVASILGLRVAGELSAYAASKAALMQLTKSMALEWARHGIRVNALCPGYVETDLNRSFFATEAGEALVRRIPQRRLGQLADLDLPLLLLCCAAGGYVTGTTLAVDGGHLVSSL